MKFLNLLSNYPSLAVKNDLRKKFGKQPVCNLSHSCFPPINRLSPIDKNSGRIWNFLSYNITLGHSLGICIYMLIHNLNGIWKYSPQLLTLWLITVLWPHTTLNLKDLGSPIYQGVMGYTGCPKKCIHTLNNYKVSVY